MIEAGATELDYVWDNHAFFDSLHDDNGKRQMVGLFILVYFLVAGNRVYGGKELLL